MRVKMRVDTTKLNGAREYDLTVDLEVLAEHTPLEVKPIYTNDSEWEPNNPLGYIEITGILAEGDYAALEDILDSYHVDYTFETAE